MTAKWIEKLGMVVNAVQLWQGKEYSNKQHMGISNWHIKDTDKWHVEGWANNICMTWFWNAIVFASLFTSSLLSHFILSLIRHGNFVNRRFSVKQWKATRSFLYLLHLILFCLLHITLFCFLYHIIFCLFPFIMLLFLPTLHVLMFCTEDLRQTFKYPRWMPVPALKKMWPCLLSWDLPLFRLLKETKELAAKKETQQVEDHSAQYHQTKLLPDLPLIGGLWPISRLTWFDFTFY